MYLAINALVFFSLVASACATAQDYPNGVGMQLTPTSTASQPAANDDCYRGGRNDRLMVKVTDLASLWHYTRRILLPRPGASAAPMPATGKPGTKKGPVWRLSTQDGGVLVSARVVW